LGFFVRVQCKVCDGGVGWGELIDVSLTGAPHA
jgi:hypothetical protein